MPPPNASGSSPGERMLTRWPVANSTADRKTHRESQTKIDAEIAPSSAFYWRIFIRSCPCALR
jgi:hypothetical protein